MGPLVLYQLGHKMRRYMRRVFVYDLCAGAALLSAGSALVALVPYVVLLVRARRGLLPE